MKVANIDGFGDLDQIKIADIPTPSPKANDIQIKIAYAAINPVDWKICAGFLRERMPYEFPITLGWDVAGVVSAVGENVSAFKPGDEVFAYARKDKIKDGTLAEYICLDAKNVALKPSGLSLSEAASIPLTGLTAWQSLFDAAKLQPEDVIFIPAGAGGVGSMAIQLAKHHGATVITTASERSHPYVEKLGADVVIDYHKEDFAEKIRELYPDGIDVVFDLMGGETLDASLTTLKSGGRLVSLLKELSPEEAKQCNISAYYVFVQPSGEQLKLIADLLASKKIASPKIKEYPFSQAKEALQELKQGHTHGKIVVKVAT